VPIVIAAQQPLLAARELVDSFSVQNFGEYQAHYQSMGIEIDAPNGGSKFDDAPAPGPDNLLAPGETLGVTIDLDQSGDVPGTYAVKVGFKSVPPGVGSTDWLPLFYPAAVVTVT
jgi:hypothetical protein